MVLIEMSPTVPVGWTHVTADEKSLKHSMSLREYSSQQGVQSSLHANVKRMFGKRQKKLGQPKHAGGHRQIHISSLPPLFCFCFRGAFSALRKEGCDFSQQCVEIMSNSERNWPAALLGEAAVDRLHIWSQLISDRRITCSQRPEMLLNCLIIMVLSWNCTLHINFRHLFAVLFLFWLSSHYQSRLHFQLIVR